MHVCRLIIIYHYFHIMFTIGRTFHAREMVNKKKEIQLLRDSKGLCGLRILQETDKG